MSVVWNRLLPRDITADRPSGRRAWIARAAVLAVIGGVLWTTLGWNGLSLLPPVALAWLVLTPPVAFALGQLLVLFELRQYPIVETLAVELALGAILLVPLLERPGGGTERFRLGLLFAAIWAGLGALAWIGTTATDRVAVGATALVAGATLAGYVIHERRLAPRGGTEP